jgi:hypothetical protein
MSQQTDQIRTMPRNYRTECKTESQNDEDNTRNEMDDRRAEHCAILGLPIPALHSVPTREEHRARRDHPLFGPPKKPKMPFFFFCDMSQYEYPALKRQAPLESFLCPITQDVMVDPVILVTGQTYERSAIERWLETHDTDPSTNLQLESKNLIPNHSLRNSIQEFTASAASMLIDQRIERQKILVHDLTWAKFRFLHTEFKEMQANFNGRPSAQTEMQAKIQEMEELTFVLIDAGSY